MALVVAAVAGALWISASGGFSQDPTTPEQAGRIQKDLQQLERAALQFAREEKRLPAQVADLVPKYVATPPTDPWGRGYVIKSGGKSRIYIWCLGADGQLKRYPPDICATVDAPGL